VSCRVVVNDEDVCGRANGSDAGHIKESQRPVGTKSWSGR
jgi:hypothetical protein